MVSASRLSELPPRDAEVGSSGRMARGQANSNVTTILPVLAHQRFQKVPLVSATVLSEQVMCLRLHCVTISTAFTQNEADTLYVFHTHYLL